MSIYTQEKRFNYSIDNKEKINEENKNEEKINKLEEQLNNINDQLLIITELLGNINNILSFRYTCEDRGGCCPNRHQTRQIVTIPYNLNYYKDFLNNESNSKFSEQKAGFVPLQNNGGIPHMPNNTRQFIFN